MSLGLLSAVCDRVYPLSHLRFYTQRLVKNPRLRERMAMWWSKRLPQISDTSGANVEDRVRDLNRNGYTMLQTLLGSNEVEEMLAWLRDKAVYDSWAPERGSFDSASPPATCHTAHFRIEDIVNCPHALSIANDPTVISIVSAWLGAKPTLSSMNIWWSYPGRAAAQEAQNFHRDVDDLKFVKLFIYLTDVTDESGPHAYVPGSHTDPRFREIRRYRDEEVVNAFGHDSIKYFVGPPSTAFLENTFGLHKGALPNVKPRLLFQAQYSLNPIGIYDYNPVRTHVAGVEGIDPYINRLYISK